jgi:hypothetical protein
MTQFTNAPLPRRTYSAVLGTRTYRKGGGDFFPQLGEVFMRLEPHELPEHDGELLLATAKEHGGYVDSLGSRRRQQRVSVFTGGLMLALNYQASIRSNPA